MRSRSSFLKQSAYLAAALLSLNHCRKAPPVVADAMSAQGITLPPEEGQGLSDFQNSAALFQYIQKSADYEMTLQLEGQKRWMAKIDCEARQSGGPGTMKNSSGGAEASPAPSSDSGTGATPGSSATNNQVASVDEGDLSKILRKDTDNDGVEEIYIFTLRPANPALHAGEKNAVLEISQVWPKAQAKKLASIAVGAYPHGLLVSANKRYVAAITQDSSNLFAVPEWYGSYGGMEGDVALPAPGSPDVLSAGYINATRLSIIDIGDIKSPSLVHEVWNEGQPLTTRLTGNSVRLLTTSRVAGPMLASSSTYVPTDVPKYGWFCDWSSEQRALYLKGFDDAIRSNRKIIYETSRLEEWLPKQFERQLNDMGVLQSTDVKALYNIKRPAIWSGRDFTHIITVDLSNPADIDAHRDVVKQVGVMANGHTVYVSPSRIWLATDPYGNSGYWDQINRYWEALNSDASVKPEIPVEKTAIHQLDISDSKRATYISSQNVDGSLLNQFSMDESDGYLRVATTRNLFNFWGRSAIESSSQVVILAANKAMNKVGEILNIKPGERLFAVRFMGSRGFLVTARQVDPLFTLDLSVPSAPKIVGELKIPGFSTYLHFMDSENLLAVGRDSNGSGWGNVNSLKLSIYNVANFAAPTEAFKFISGGLYSGSDALNEHKAFTYFQTEVQGDGEANKRAVNILALPYDETYIADGAYSSSNTMRVFDVDAKKGFVLLGDISHKRFLSSSDEVRYRYYGYEYPKRSFIVGQNVISISNLGLVITDIAKLSKAEADRGDVTVKF